MTHRFLRRGKFCLVVRPHASYDCGLRQLFSLSQTDGFVKVALQVVDRGTDQTTRTKAPRLAVGAADCNASQRVFQTLQLVLTAREGRFTG